MEMLARCERMLFKVCLFYTDRQPDNVCAMYQDIVCNLWQAWPSFRHESKENMCENPQRYLSVYIRNLCTFAALFWSDGSVVSGLLLSNNKHI